LEKETLNSAESKNSFSRKWNRGEKEKEGRGPKRVGPASHYIEIGDNNNAGPVRPAQKDKAKETKRRLPRRGR